MRQRTTASARLHASPARNRFRYDYATLRDRVFAIGGVLRRPRCFLKAIALRASHGILTDISNFISRFPALGARAEYGQRAIARGSRKFILEHFEQ